MLLHRLQQLAVPLSPQQRTQLLLGGRKAKRTTTDVVHPLTHQRTDILQRVGRPSDDELLAQQLAGLTHGHVLPAQMHPIGPNLLHQSYAVVDYEHRIMLLAELLHLDGQRIHHFIRRSFHAQLNPSASPLQRHAAPLQVAHRLRTVRDELQSA